MAVLILFFMHLRIIKSFAFLLVLLPISSVSLLVAQETDRPNVIIIYSDDHGYTDLGAYGIDPHVDTPQMDALARGGALMTTGYSSAPQCRPSRCGLLTGRIQNEFGFSQNHSDAGAGKGTLPRVYPEGTDMAGQPLLTIADRMKALGYVTGFSGKWHCGTNDDKDAQYDPRGRGFDEYLVGLQIPAYANIDLEGNQIPHTKLTQWPEGIPNRVILQGKYSEAFIERNQDKPFFLYFPIFGPHLPTISRDDPYYKAFPNVDYPHYDDAQDDVRRQGLALLKAMDDSIGGVVQKLRELGLEERTLILFAGDNGAPTKLRTGHGTPDANSWNGSNNVPMRGAKGSLQEGGIRVPMFAYWKGIIEAGQSIEEMVTTLDFSATVIAAGGGVVPAEFDGVDVLPRLTGKNAKLVRTEPMFWDFYTGQVIRDGEWKLWRNGTGTLLFHISEDPAELINLAWQQPERVTTMSKQLDQWTATLRSDSTYKISAASSSDDDLRGAPTSVQPDPRYLVPYDDPKPMPYPLPISSPGQPQGGTPVAVESVKQAETTRSLRFDFNSDGDFDGWDDKVKLINNALVADGVLSGVAKSGQGKLEQRGLHIDGSKFKRVVVRIKSGGLADQLKLRWGTATNPKLDNERLIRAEYQPGVWDEVALDLSHNSEWHEQVITTIRLQPCKQGDTFEIDWINFE